MNIFFELHIGIKSHSAQWHKCGNVPGGGGDGNLRAGFREGQQGGSEEKRKDKRVYF